MKDTPKYRVNSKFKLVKSGHDLCSHRITSIRAQVVKFEDGRPSVYLFFNEEGNKYLIALPLGEEALEGGDLHNLDDCFYELDETPEQAAQRKALEHLQSAARELGYNLVKA